MRRRPWPLGRLLAVAISAMFLVALVGVEAIHLRSAQAHMQRQLESLAQDAATSLGLSLGALLRGGDPALAETVINPAFDRGHYERIEYLSASGERVVSRHLPARRGRAIPAGSPRCSRCTRRPPNRSSAPAGARPGGCGSRCIRASRTSSCGTRRAIRSILLLLIYAATLLVLRLVLRGVLQPLAEVEKAAQAISSRRFVTLRLRPSTRELARVVEAMNALSLKVSEALDAETRRAERLQAAAYHDPVSGLRNALGFTARFEATLRRRARAVRRRARAGRARGSRRDQPRARRRALRRAAARAAARDGRSRGGGGRIRRALEQRVDGPRAAAAARAASAENARAQP